MPEAREYRLIVTGSREYDDRLTLRATLNKILDSLQPDATLVVVHGGDENPDYSTSADKIAGEWALEAGEQGLPVRQEAHPAGWEDPCRASCQAGHRQDWRGRSICPAAGPYRNEEMVSAGANAGLGAIRVGAKSTGTKDCLARMMRHGIEFELVVQGRARGLPQDLIGRPRALPARL
jgi:YspA, cpYpsA-related SLOG family